MKKTTKSFLHAPSTTGVLLAVLFVAFSVVGLLLIQAPLEEPQDVRRQASIDNGQVEVTHTVSPEGTVFVNQEVEVVFSITTHGVPTDGIQVLFNVVSSSFDTMTADIIPGAGLQAAGSQVQRTADGFLVQTLALPAQIGQPFASDSVMPFLSVTFTPREAGTVVLHFDQEESISLLHGSDPLEDKLKHISPVSLVVEDPTDTPGVSPSPSPSTNPSPSPSTSPSPSPTPAVGGIEVVSCNEQCASNAECGINQRCYDVDGVGRCRQAVNPTNERCITQQAGQNYACNKGCADSFECASGLVCWYNQCRDPQNVESTSCTALTETESESLAASCNTSCSTNADCNINLRCYQGACRLVTNPSSSSCAAATEPTVSSVYAQPKGGTDAGSSSNSDTGASGAATIGFAASPQPSSVPTDDSGVKEKGAATSLLDSIPVTENETALDVLLTMLKTPESALPLIVIGAGLGLLILALIVLLVKRMLRNRPKAMASPTTSKQSRASTGTTQSAKTPVEQRQNMNTPLTTARSMTTPTASMPTQETLTRRAESTQHQPPTSAPSEEKASSPAPVQQENTPSAPSATNTQGSSMLQRMKDKGIAVPNKTTHTSTEEPKSSQ